MSEIKDGGPAFPRTTEAVSNRTDAADYKHLGEDGLSLRDYFAAQALPAAVTAFMTSDSAWDGYKDLAESVWRIADAMLKAREG